MSRDRDVYTYLVPAGKEEEPVSITLPRYYWSHVLSDLSYSPYSPLDAAERIRDALEED